jgi:hypothetical protein
MTEPVRISADIDREDRLLAGLTARQLAILAAAAVCCPALRMPTSASLAVLKLAALKGPAGAGPCGWGAGWCRHGAGC